ncbi:UbiA family prenyltransferase (macronuclear) [Tetrahymena thermophila SB210]|uniref:UbiA family prenyltransferase n=1 Tax=Tetrahymena thermophila (strain SB210) TaxID=312017 RepID=I7LU21_TETTS|nr:UbiA family prenyltransferase [Tetrahymena thermophila SB210]EAR89266.2 UbiA family prenyltransferase [Tetrahymena thermophila SB210]|eukprot:XP_001009511.2 UbiA family prenyltransferase [Tetrahymena thermophila SB210]
MIEDQPTSIQSIGHIADLLDEENLEEEQIQFNAEDQEDQRQFQKLIKTGQQVNTSKKQKIKLIKQINNQLIDQDFQNTKNSYSIHHYEHRQQLKLIEILSKDPSFRKTDEIDWVISQTQDIEFFKNINNQAKSDVHRRCCQRMRYEFHSANDLIFKIGSLGNKFYIIIGGKAGVYIRNIIDYSSKQKSQTSIEVGDPKYDLVGGLFYFKELSAGMSFGELALLEKKPRAASILCHTDLHVAVLVKEDFDQILKNFEEQKLTQAAEFLDQVQPFSKWNQRRQITLFMNSHAEFYKINQVIYQEGSKPDSFYIIKSGTFAVMKTKQNNPKKIKKAQENPDYIKKQIQKEKIFENDETNTNQIDIKNQLQSHKPTQIKINKPGTSENSKKDTKNPTNQKEEQFQNLTQKQLQQYLAIKRKELLQPESSDDEDEQDILFKRHELFVVKQKDAKYQKPISVKIAELGQYEYFGEEEITLKCKKRVFTVVCTSSHGELIRITKRDFELRVLSDLISKNFIKDKIQNKEQFYKSQLEKIGMQIHNFNNFFFDSKLELNRDKLSKIQVDKTQSNRNFNEVKDFIIGIDFVQEISENQVKKNHFHKRLAKKEIDVEDLMNGTYIQQNSSNSSSSNINKLFLKDSINESKNYQSNLDGSRFNTSQKSQNQSYNSLNLNNLFPPSPQNKGDFTPKTENGEQMYQSKRIYTPERISVSVQHEFQITSDLMNQDIKELVNERINKIKEEESVNHKSSAFRKSLFIESQLKKYVSQTKSQPASPSLSSPRKISILDNDSNQSPANKVENSQQHDTPLNKNEKTKSSSIWNALKKLKEQDSLFNQQNNQDKSLENQMMKKMSSTNQDFRRDIQNNTDMQEKQQPKKDWVDSYTQSFQENLMRNLQEKFKGSKLNVMKIKKHLKQKVINIIPDEEFRNVPESIIQKPQIIVPEMNDKVKLFKRIVMKSISIQNQKDPNSFINKLKNKIKQEKVQKIKDGFVSHLLSSINNKKTSNEPQNDEKSLDTIQFSTIQTQEKSPLMTPFSRKSSIRGHSLQQSNLNFFSEVSSPLIMNRMQRGYSTLHTVSNGQNQLSEMNLFQQAAEKFRNSKTADQSRKPSLSKAESQPKINQFNIQKQNYMNQELEKINLKTHKKSKSGLVGNSVKGYNYYEHQQKIIYNQRMKSISSSNKKGISQINAL